MKTLIYHITHCSNIDSILQAGELKCCSSIHQQSVNYKSIANQNIQDRRSTFPVPIYPHGVVHDYVPFYFAPRSPMLYAIHKGNVEGYEGGQSDVIYLVTSVQRISQQGYSYVFTDGHAIMAFSEYYNELGDLDKIDWAVMRNRFWADTSDDSDRKRRRQAEFLVYKSLNIIDIEIFITSNTQVQNNILSKLRSVGHNIPVDININWYY